VKAQRVAGVEFQLVSQPVDARIAIVFLHGLDTDAEHGWGRPGASKTFVTRIIDDIPSAAVATFSYPSALRHFVEDGVTIDALAHGVADVFCERLLKAYRTVVVIGHCLGGSIAVTALRLVSERAPQKSGWSPAWGSVALFLIDAPFAVPDDGPSEWLHGLMEALTYTGELARSNAAFWGERIVGPPKLRLPVEAHALISDSSSWVTPLRPDAWLPDTDVRRIALSHLDIARPAEHGPFPTYDYIVEWLANLTNRESPALDPNALHLPRRAKSI
jgi:hypothetical protein